MCRQHELEQQSPMDVLKSVCVFFVDHGVSNLRIRMSFSVLLKSGFSNLWEGVLLFLCFVDQRVSCLREGHLYKKKGNGVCFFRV